MLVTVDGECTVSQLDLIPTQDQIVDFNRDEFNNPFIETDNHDNDSRFSNVSAKTSDEINTTINKSIPLRTQSSNIWVVNLFKEWRMWRKFKEHTRADSHFPIPALQKGSPVSYRFLSNINFVMCIFYVFNFLFNNIVMFHIHIHVLKSVTKVVLAKSGMKLTVVY